MKNVSVYFSHLVVCWNVLVGLKILSPCKQWDNIPRLSSMKTVGQQPGSLKKSHLSRIFVSWDEVSFLLRVPLTASIKTIFIMFPNWLYQIIFFYHISIIEIQKLQFYKSALMFLCLLVTLLLLRRCIS